MWRRVSCEQLLDTSQSILRLSGSIVEWCGDLPKLALSQNHCLGRKGNRFLFLYLVA